MTILVQQQLRDAAREIANWSGSLTDTWVSSQASYMWIVGCIDEDDQKYAVVRIEADAYGHKGESEKLAEFFRLANPKAVLALLDELDTANANHENAIAHMQGVCAERDQLKADNAELRKAAASAFEAGRAASRRPIAIIQRSGNSWNVFEQRYNDDRTERNDRFIRGGFVTSVDATSWARSNGYEVEV